MSIYRVGESNEYEIRTHAAEHGATGFPSPRTRSARDARSTAAAEVRRLRKLRSRGIC